MECEICHTDVGTKSTLANHVRWVHKRQPDVKCENCGDAFHAANMKQHQTKCFRSHPCLVCGEKTHNEFYCSKRCSAKSNNENGSIGFAKYRKNKNITRKQTYRDICFKYWTHQCALCPWTISLDVHHIDDDHSNNDPVNLIPLCQNHHTMTRMVDHRDTMKIELQKLSMEHHESFTLS